jgi:hypothetical protein
MAGERTFLFKLLGNSDGAVAAFKKLAREGQESLEKVGKIGSALGGAFDFVKKGAFIAIGGLTAVAGAAAAAVAAAAADEKSQKLLADQLVKSADATLAQVSATELFVEKAMLATGIADDLLRPALGNLVRATNDVEKAQSLFTLALDISAATGRDLETVTLGLGRAATGQIGALTRLGIPLDEGAKKSKDFGAILTTLQDQFGGAAATAADTFSGRVKILKTGLGEVVEEIGFALLPVAEKFVAFLTNNVLPALKAAVDGFREKGLSGAVAYFGAAFGDMTFAVLDRVEALILSFYELQKSFVDLIGPLAAGVDFLRAFGDAIVGGDGIITIEQQLINRTEQISRTFDGFRNSVSNARATLNLSGNALSKFVDQTDRIGQKVLPKAKDATDLFADSLDKVKKTSGGVAKTVDDTKANLEKYTSALKSSTSAQKSLTNAQKANKEARAGLVKADSDLLNAQENFNRAVAGYGADSEQAKAAQRELSKAQRSVANAGFAVEEAVFAVTDAEKKLAELRADPLSSPQAIRQAEIDLAQAKLAVADASDTEFEATNGLKDAQLKLNEAVSGAIDGSDTYNEFLKLVNDAKQAQADASDRVTEATERETEAFEALAEAIKKVADAAALVPGAVIPTLPGVVTPTPTSSTVPSDIRGGTGANIVINTGIGTNGVEAGRQIVEVLQQYSRIGGNNFLEFAVS